VNVSLGDAVKAGQQLAEVDSPDYGSARADLAKAEADLALKRKALERAKGLLEAQVIARKDAEQAEADAAQSASEAERARLRVANLLPAGHAGSGEHIPLSAPMAGWVTERNATPGQELGSATSAPLFVVSDLRRLWLAIDLPEHLLSHVKTGAEVRLKVDAWPDRVFTARIDRIGLTIDPATRRVPVRALVDNPDLQLKPEMYAQVSVPRPDAEQAVAVPNGALVAQGYDTLLYAQRAPGQYERRIVRVGLRGPSVSYVTDGVRDGETVVVQGALLLGAQLADNAQGQP
jgi:cobalt-zinc-cadmium efflux system membrane fusion protein